MKRNAKLAQNARNLRNEATKEENHLWYDFLRTHELSFRRQYVIGNYIVDFYCPSLKLVIELDGSQHFEEEAAAYDRERTAFLEKQGCCVIRYTNDDIHRNFDGVCEHINQVVQWLQTRQSLSLGGKV